MKKIKSYATVESYSDVESLSKGLENFHKRNPSANITKVNIEQANSGLTLSLFWDN